MKKVTVVTMAVFVALSFLIGATTSWAQVSKIQIIPLDTFVGTKTPVSANAGFDIGWVDSGTYYLAERTVLPGAPGTGRVDIFNAIEDEFEGFIPKFVGTVAVSTDLTGLDGRNSRKSGPNGIVVIPSYPYSWKRELWAGDGDSTVKVVDLQSRTIVDTIKTGGFFRADELAYDPIHRIIMVANDLERAQTKLQTPPLLGEGNPAFVTFISTVPGLGGKHPVLGHIVYDGQGCAKGGNTCAPGHGPNADGGLEQPVWDAPYFYFSVPSTTDNSGGEIDVIDPMTMNIVKRFDAFGCNPTGLSLGPFHHLVMGCGPPATIIMNDRDGTLVGKPITDVYNADEVWFNPGDMRYYIAAGAPGIGTPPQPVLGVIDAITNKWIQNIPTGPGAHSVAVNPLNNHVFVPNAADQGISVFEPADKDRKFDLDQVCEERGRGEDQGQNERGRGEDQGHNERGRR